MIELPEARTLAAQIRAELAGKRIQSVIAMQSPHKFAFFRGDPQEVPIRMQGEIITGASAHGGIVELETENLRLGFFDGVRFRLLAAGETRPPKHQLLLEFDDGRALAMSVQMYGAFLLFGRNEPADDGFHTGAHSKPSPLSDAFDAAYFDGLWNATPEKYSVKAFLATEQRIPGLGNGVLQDILWHAKIHPKTKLSALDGAAKQRLFQSVKSTLAAMTQGGGRDTEKDLFGNAGGYRTILSNKTLTFPCPACGAGLVRTAYLGGNIYFCPGCQNAL